MYIVVQDWEARESEMDFYPHPIITVTRVLLRNVGLLKYYEEATFMKGNSELLMWLIHQWDVHRHAFHVVHDYRYHPTKEYMYFITGISKRGEDFPQFPDVPIGVATKS
jgi:hypothetical protein